MTIKLAAKTIRAGNLYFHTEHFGDSTNPTCLLIAGAMASARFWTDTFCALLANFGFFVIRYDHRDMGESCAIDWQKAPYNLSDLAFDAISILDGYGIKQAHFVGHSMGGYIVQTIALEFSKRALSICSISAGPIGAGVETDLPLTDREQAIQNKTWEVMLSRQDGSSKESMIQSFLPVWEFLNGEFPLDKEMADAYTRDLVLRSHHLIRAGNHHELVMRFLDLEKSRGVLQNIDVPALIIHGDADSLVLPRNGRALAHAISGSHLMMIPGMGHMFFHRGLEEKIATLLASYMKNVSLILLYRERLHLQKAHFVFIDHDDAMVATVFKVTLANGTSLILKICSRAGDYAREVYFLKHFTGLLPVPRLIQHISPETNIDGAILMEYLHGKLLTTEDLSDKLAYEIGSMLACIHLNRVGGYGDLTQPENLTSDPRVPFTLKFEEGVEECKDHLPSTLIGKCRQYYNQHVDLLISADGPCVIHRDFRPGNLIVDHGQLQGIIDWSSARGGFAEEDFCPLEFGEWSANLSYKNSFLSGYASVRKIPDYHRILPLLRLSRAIATIGFTVKRGIWESKGAKIYQFNRQYLESLVNRMF